jgi:hypothetical protein
MKMMGLLTRGSIVNVEVQEPFSCELSVMAGNDRIRDPKMKNDVSDEIYDLLGANFGQGLRIDLLSKFINNDKQVG